MVLKDALDVLEPAAQRDVLRRVDLESQDLCRLVEFAVVLDRGEEGADFLGRLVDCLWAVGVEEVVQGLSMGCVEPRVVLMEISAQQRLEFGELLAPLPVRAGNL